MGLGEISKSLTDYIKTKCTNPFFGTLFFVWIIFHWKLIYIVFSFEKGTSLEDKVNFISQFLDEPAFIWNMLWCILISFGVLIASYILTNAARFITELSNEIVNPSIFFAINWLSNKANTISKDRYEKMQKEKDSYKEKYEKERESRLHAEQERDEMEDKYKKAIRFNENEIELEENEPNFDRSIIQLYKKMKRNETVDKFSTMIEIVNSNEMIDKREDRYKVCRYFLQNDIITVASSSTLRNSFKFTETGKELKKYHQQMQE